MEQSKKFISTWWQTFGNRGVSTPPRAPRSEAPKAAPIPPKPQVSTVKVFIQKGAQAAPTPPKATSSNK